MSEHIQLKQRPVDAPPEWRAAVLENLDRGGPVCRHAADYLRAHDVPIGFAPQSTGARWTMDGRIELSTRHYSAATPPGDVRLLGSIVHEATHLEQGPPLALTVEGEVGGWQAEFRARKELGRPITNAYWKTVAELPDHLTGQHLRKARTTMREMAGWRYLIWLLPLRPSWLTKLASRLGGFWVRRRKR